MWLKGAKKFIVATSEVTKKLHEFSVPPGLCSSEALFKHLCYLLSTSVLEKINRN
jgi:hypothetical protein